MAIQVRGGVYQAAAADVNLAVSADVDAAVAAAAGLRLVGYSAESGGAAAFEIVNGATGAAGTTIVTVDLAASESKEFWCWPGIDAANGLSIDYGSGTINIVLYYITVA